MPEQHPRMSAGDQMMHLGEGDPSRRSSMVNLEILQSAPEWDRVVHAFDRMSRVVPRFRQKVVTPTLPTTAPRWVVDPDFDLGYHLRRVRLPEPGTLRQLLDLADTIASSPLDPARPLWTVTLVEGLEGGRAALVDHLSHVVADGVGGVAMAVELYDLTEDAPLRDMPPVPTPADLSPNELSKQGLRELPGLGLRRGRALAGAAVHAVRHPRRSVEFVQSLGRVLHDSGKRSPLLTRRGVSRRTSTLQVDLAALKAAGKKYDGSVNDAYLAGLTLGLQAYHRASGVDLETLRMAVPVNLRQEGDSMEGNAFTGIFFEAPMREPDLGRRVSTIRDAVRAGRDEPAVDVMGLIAPAVVNLPMVVLQELNTNVSMADVQASNVPSYPVDTWIAGRRVVGQYGLGPLPGVAMMATMISRNGVCYIAFRYDPLSFDDQPLLEASLREGFVELVGEAAVSATDGELERGER